MFIFSVSYPPVRAFSDSGRRLRPRTEQRSCRSAIPAKLSARWQKNAGQRVVVRPFVTRRKGGFWGGAAPGGFAARGLAFFAAFWSAVNRGLCPRVSYVLFDGKKYQNHIQKKPPHSRLQRNENNRQPACPEREAGKGVRRRGQTACCLPSRHSLNGACFCAVKSCSCCARSTRAGGCSREKRHADGFGTFNFATLVFLLLARHNPQAVSARAACVG